MQRIPALGLAAEPAGRAAAPAQIGMFPPIDLPDQSPETARAFLVLAGKAAGS
jgi:hypothetical protein